MATRLPDGTPITETFRTYLIQGFRLEEFFRYVAEWAQDSDVLQKARTAFQSAEKKQNTDFLQKLLEEQRPSAADLLRSFGVFTLEVKLSRHVDNYLTYLSELLSLIFVTRPETLRSSETVTLQEVLSHERMEDFISRAAEQRVEALSYKGMVTLNKYMSDKLAFPLFEESEKLETAARIVDTRNLIVHNRGIVNRRARNVPGDVGEQVKLTEASVEKDAEFLRLSGFDIDTRALSKFGLPVGGPKKMRRREP